jgi:hypothetical protein
MVTNRRAHRERGALATECVVALGILAAVMIPLSFSFMQETKMCRAYYHRAVALEIIDGEMELLVAGEWKAFRDGRQTYPVVAASATNLPPGEFSLTLRDGLARLEWTPKSRGVGGAVVREVKLK